MSMLRQTATTILLGFQTLPARWKAALTMTAGIGFMIFALLSILVIAESIRVAVAASGAPGRAVIHAPGDAWLGGVRSRQAWRRPSRKHHMSSSPPVKSILALAD